LYLSTKSLKLVYEEYDPYYALFNFWTSEVAITSLVVLGLVLILSLFIERPWCKYACPFGALLGLTNFIKLFKIRRHVPTCINCNRCSNNCPMNIEVSEKEVVNDHQCISCNICTSENVCPVDDTVSFATKAKPQKNYKSKFVALSLIAILIVGIGTAKIIGIFQTESTKTPRKITSGEFVGEYDPLDIRGSYELSDISEYFDIPVETLAKAFEIESDDLASFQVKDLEATGLGIETSTVRDFVGVYNGLLRIEEVHDLPESARAILIEENKISTEDKKQILDVKADKNGDYEGETTDEEITEHSAINSTTTVKMALELGLTLEEIEQVIGIKIVDESKLIKDVCKENDLRFSEMKDNLNSLLN
jgi:ferredoxin